jgi:hypothetical protein
VASRSSFPAATPVAIRAALFDTKSTALAIYFFGALAAKPRRDAPRKYIASAARGYWGDNAAKAFSRQDFEQQHAYKA